MRQQDIDELMQHEWYSPDEAAQSALIVSSAWRQEFPALALPLTWCCVIEHLPWSPLEFPHYQLMCWSQVCKCELLPQIIFIAGRVK